MTFEEQEQTQSEVSSETPSESPQSEGSGEAAKAASSEQTKTENDKYVPYDRFQEVIAQKNQFAEQLKALSEKSSSLEAQVHKMSQGELSKKQEDALISRLKGIDPEFGGRIEEMHAKLSRVDQMEQKLQAYEHAQLREKAVTTVNGLHEQYKVPAEMRDMYNAMLINAENQGLIKGLNDVPGYFKQVHENITKMIDGVKRSERESYVAQKKQDSKAPTSQPKGKPALPGNTKPQFSRDPELAKQQIVSRYLKTAKAESDL